MNKLTVVSKICPSEWYGRLFGELLYILLTEYTVCLKEFSTLFIVVETISGIWNNLVRLRMNTLKFGRFRYFLWLFSFTAASYIQSENIHFHFVIFANHNSEKFLGDIVVRWMWKSRTISLHIYGAGGTYTAILFEAFRHCWLSLRTTSDHS